MTPASPSSNQPGQGASKKEKRDVAREQARVAREEALKKRKRKKLITQLSVVVGIVAVVSVIALVIFAPKAPGAASPLNMASGGIVLTGADGTITAETTPSVTEPVATDQDPSLLNIIEYVDFQCPVCQSFEATNASAIEELVSSGQATLEIRPIAFLDSASSGNLYSTRSANAMACVASEDPDNYLAASNALFANQPAEGANGMTDDELISVISSAGIAVSDEMTQCITNVTYKDWVEQRTEAALNGPLLNTDVEKVAGTPTVLVNGQQYGGAIADAAQFTAFLEQVASTLPAAGDSGTDATEAPATSDAPSSTESTEPTSTEGTE